MILLTLLIPLITLNWIPRSCKHQRKTPLLMQRRGFTPNSDGENCPFPGGTIGERRTFLLTSAGALTILSSPEPLNAVTKKRSDFNGRFLKALLESSSIYTIKADPKNVARLSSKKLLRMLRSKRAVFIGEHHPDTRDHLLQAALVRHLYDEMEGNSLAVGLEAVQRRFQTVLDDYIEGRIEDQDLVELTDWESSWVWPFKAYEPIFRVCRELGVKMIALDVNSEDRARVELGGLASLGKNKLQEYIPDLDAFEHFGNTQAFHRYVSYTLQRPYDLQKKYNQKMTVRTTLERTIPFDNFVARQAFRDEGMASASVSWLNANSDGLLGFVGGNHVKFGRGVPARVARTLLSVGSNGMSEAAVATILLNPTPFDTEAVLRRCDGTMVVNEVCLRNDIEVQNYVVRLDYEGSVKEREEGRLVKDGGAGLLIADYLIFSPRMSR